MFWASNMVARQLLTTCCLCLSPCLVWNRCFISATIIPVNGILNTSHRNAQLWYIMSRSQNFIILSGYGNWAMPTSKKIPLVYCLTKETLPSRNSKNQSCFIQAVISSIYVEVNQQNVFAVSCFERISNFVQRYHQTGESQGRNLTSRMPSLS